MKKALIHVDQDRIHQFVATDDDIFPVSESYRWVDVADGTTEFDTWDGTKVIAFVEPIPPAPEDTEFTKEDLTRMFRQAGLTIAQMNQAQRDRGKPIP